MFFPIKKWDFEINSIIQHTINIWKKVFKKTRNCAYKTSIDINHKTFDKYGLIFFNFFPQKSYLANQSILNFNTSILTNEIGIILNKTEKEEERGRVYSCTIQSN